MREVQIARWCDLCWADGDGPEGSPVKAPAASSWTVSAGSGDGSKPVPKVVDVCEVHAKQFADLALLLSNVGQLPTAKKDNPPGSAAERRVDCPVCRLNVAYGSLVAHIWNHHRAGEQRPVVHGKCPDCGEQFQTGQGMGQHRRSAHGYDAITDALRGVKGYRVTGREREEL